MNLPPHDPRWCQELQPCSPQQNSGNNKEKGQNSGMSFKETSQEMPEVILSTINAGLTFIIIQPPFKLLIFQASQEL